LTSKLPSMMSRYCIVDIVRCLGSALVVEVMYRCCKVTLRPCYVDVMWSDALEMYCCGYVTLRWCIVEAMCFGGSALVK
jgi:hypothetical protein